MRNTKLLFLTLGISIATMGCGGTRLAMPGVSSQSTLSDGMSNGPVSNPTPSPSPSSTGSPPLSFRVGTTGYNSTTITVYTRTVLKVEFTPGIQDQVIKGTGEEPAYSQLGVYIGVGTANLSPTEMLNNGLNTGSAQTSHIFDLSSQFTPKCQANDPSCSQAVTITIAKPNNDYFCLNYGEYCAWTHVYQTHPWHGTLTIQTDDTSSL